MVTQERQHLVTGEEFGEQRRHLLLSGVKDDSPEMDQLWRLVRERNDYLWDRYAKPLIETHRGEWAAVSLNCDVIFASTSYDVMANATDRFGPANFVYGKMAEFRGHVLHRC